MQPVGANPQVAAVLKQGNALRLDNRLGAEEQQMRSRPGSPPDRDVWSQPVFGKVAGVQTLKAEALRRISPAHGLPGCAGNRAAGFEQGGQAFALTLQRGLGAIADRKADPGRGNRNDAYDDEQFKQREAG